VGAKYGKFLVGGKVLQGLQKIFGKNLIKIWLVVKIQLSLRRQFVKKK